MNIKVFVAVMAMMMVGTAAFAGGDGGFYLGGSVGHAGIDYNDNDIRIDDGDFSYKFFGGYNFGAIPAVDLAVEAAYMDFGTQNSDNDKLNTAAFGVFGLVGFNVGPVGLFGKLGGSRWDAELGNGRNDNGFDPTYGIGLRFQVRSVSIRTEYEVLDTSGFNVDLFTVGAAYTF